MAASEAPGRASRSRAEAARASAVALLEKGDFPRALAAYDEALVTARETGDPVFVDWMFVCRAAAAIELGPADAELVELKRILLRATESQTAFRAAYGSARVYELRRDFRKALFYNRIAREHADRMEDPFLRLTSENQRGTLLVVDSRFEEAAEAYRGALALAAPPAPVAESYRALLKDNLGYCLLSLDSVADGLALVHQAFDTLEGLKAAAHTVFPLLDLCFGYLKADRYAEARYFGEAGLERVPLSGDPRVERSYLYLLGEACHLAGDEAAARGYFDRLAAHYPEFRNLRAYLEVFDFRNVINLRT